MMDAILTSSDPSTGLFHRPTCAFGVQHLFDALSCAHGVYPGFREWLLKVVEAPFGERAIFVTTSGSRILGIAIAKRSESERKLCTLWVERDVRGSGVAALLADSVFDWLGTRRPLFSVPEERISEFRGLLRSWDFAESQIIKGYYRPGKAEFVFNGTLRAPLNS